MELWEHIRTQRIQHIVDSYQLGGQELPQTNAYLADLLQSFPLSLVELALVETLVDVWVRVPPIRGVEFVVLAHEKLKSWQHQPIISTITAEQFQQITGLDPSPVFGPTEVPPNRSRVQPS